MTIEDQVAAIFARANPVPSLAQFDPIELVDIDRLTDQSERSSEMSELHTIESELDKQPKRRLIVGLVAAGIIVVATAAVVIALANRPPEVVAGPAEVSESTLVAQTTSPTPTSQPADLFGQFGPLEPGPYAITDVPPFNITITVPDGWEKLRVPATIWAAPNQGVNLGFGTVDNLYADPCAIDLGMLDPPPGPSVDDLVAAIAALPGIETTAPQEVTVDGYAAKYIELSGPERGCADEEASGMWNIPNGDRMPVPGAGGPNRLWIVDVAGNRLVIGSELREYATPTEIAELDQMLESIQIELS